MATNCFGAWVRIIIALMLLNMYRIDFKCSKWTLGWSGKREQEERTDFCRQVPFAFGVMKQSSGWQICAHVSLFPYREFLKEELFPEGQALQLLLLFSLFFLIHKKINLEYKKIQMKMTLLVFYISGRNDPFIKPLLKSEFDYSLPYNKTSYSSILLVILYQT